jgi:hypothetical protein
MQRLASLSGDALLDDLHVIVGSHRRVTAELILHLGEVDARRLHVEKGFSSLFSYCVELLRFSEDEACRRIEAARLARRFPAIYPLLQTGTVSLTVLGLLKVHLTDNNHQELLAGVSGSTVRHAKEWLAARFPQPDVPWSIRKRPESRAIDASPVSPRTMSNEASPVSPSSPQATTNAPVSPQATSNGASPVSPRAATDGASPVSPRAATDSASPVSPRAATDEASPASPLATPNATFVTAEQASSGSPNSAEPRSASPAARVEPLVRGCVLMAPPTPAARARVEPLSRDRFLVKFTTSRVMREKLEQACDLMRHTNPTGELAVVLECAVDLLIAELEKKKLGRTGRPQKKPRFAKESQVTRAARREVVGCDGWRCSFVADDGRRCDARGFLEFDHKTPRGRGGSSQANNLRVLCRAHNRWAAERVYGKVHVSRAISAARNKNIFVQSTGPPKICPTGPSHP